MRKAIGYIVVYTFHQNKQKVMDHIGVELYKTNDAAEAQAALMQSLPNLYKNVEVRTVYEFKDPVCF